MINLKSLLVTRFPEANQTLKTMKNFAPHTLRLKHQKYDVLYCSYCCQIFICGFKTSILQTLSTVNLRLPPLPTSYLTTSYLKIFVNFVCIKPQNN